MDETKTYLGLDVDTSKIILKDLIKRNIQYEYNFPLSTYEFQMPQRGGGERIAIKMALSNVEIQQMRQLNMDVEEFAAERILEQLIKFYNKK